MAISNTITTENAQAMLTHWLGTPPNGYKGSDYGADVKSILMTPMGGGVADDLIAKFKQDVPIFDRASPGAINVYAVDLDFDKKGLIFQLGDVAVTVQDIQ